MATTLQSYNMKNIIVSLGTYGVPWGNISIRKEAEKWLNQLEAVAGLKAKAVAVPVGPTKREMGTRLVHEIMPLQKAKASN